jgi:DNA-binding MarR family transcriptional regulator
MMNRGKSLLTVNEKMVLHLRRYDRYYDDFIVPPEVSQNGIAGALGTSQNHISKAAKKLMALDAITSRLARVEGEPRRKKVYFLTSKGFEIAEDIRYKLSKKHLFIRDRDGMLKKILFKDLDYYLRGNGSSSGLELILRASREGILDLQRGRVDRDFRTKKEDIYN